MCSNNKFAFCFSITIVLNIEHTLGLKYMEHSRFKLNSCWSIVKAVLTARKTYKSLLVQGVAAHSIKL